MNMNNKDDGEQRRKYSSLTDCCTISNSNKIEIEKEILFLQQKYEKIKNKLNHKKLLGSLNQPDIEQIGNIMNILAMKHSQGGNHKLAEEWLRRSLKHGEISQKVRIVTYNNLACIYKQANDLQLALFYISKAQKQADYLCLENEGSKLLKVVTDCSLNLCAILSAMGEHYRALRAARRALITLKSSQSLQNNFYNSLYPLAKYNEAVQLERLKMYEQATIAYSQVNDSPGCTQQLRKRVTAALLQIEIKIQTKKQKQKTTKRTTKRVKLSLPKFCFQSNNERRNHHKQMKEKPKRKSSFFKIQDLENVKQYQTLTIGENQNRIKVQNFESKQKTGRIRKNILSCVENF